MTESVKSPGFELEVGSRVITPEGEGKVISYDKQKGVITVQLDDGAVDEFPEEEIDEKKC